MTKIVGNKRGMIMNQALTKAIKHWCYVEPLVRRPRNRHEFDKLVTQLDELLDAVGDNESHRLMGLVDILSHLIADYENEYSKNIKARGIDALRFLMESHHLQQADLPEIASQGVMSEILNGKRPLNLRQVKLLAKRFNVDPSTFID
jgi:HTH-type transcriptional regulator/antitoxin HigA